MEGIKYVQKNRIVVDTASQDENSALVAEHSNSIVTENPIWFDPPHPDFSDLNAMVDNWNATPKEQRTQQMWDAIADYNSFRDKYYSKFGYSCGVISYLTSGAFRNSGLRFGVNSLLSAPPWVFPYVGDEQFWYLQNFNLENHWGMFYYDCGICKNLISEILYDDVIGNTQERYLSGMDWRKLGFYNRSRIMALGQPYISSPIDELTDITVRMAQGQMYNFMPNFTGNKGVLPVGLVMLRDIILKTTNENLNNFGIYGFVIVMPFFIEPSQVVRGFSLGKEIFVVGNGLKAEVFLGTITENRELNCCCISNQNLNSDINSGGLSNLFNGNDGKLRFSSSIAVDDRTYEDIDCKNVCHEIVDFSVPGSCNGVFYFKSPITYDMGVKYLVFGMRPYDINGNGKEYPQSTNPYGTDTSFLGNYALIDISAKKFYLI